MSSDYTVSDNPQDFGISPLSNGAGKGDRPRINYKKFRNAPYWERLEERKKKENQENGISKHTTEAIPDDGNNQSGNGNGNNPV